MTLDCSLTHVLQVPVKTFLKFAPIFSNHLRYGPKNPRTISKIIKFIIKSACSKAKEEILAIL